MERAWVTQDPADGRALLTKGHGRRDLNLIALTNAWN